MHKRVSLCIVYLSYLSIAAGFDYVLWSSKSAKYVCNYGNLQDVISTASNESPLVVLRIDSFSLPAFNRYIDAYGSQSSKSLLADDMERASLRNLIHRTKPVLIPLSLIGNQSTEYRMPVLIYDVLSYEAVNNVLSEINRRYSQYLKVLSSNKAFVIEENKIRHKRVSSDLKFPEVEELNNPRTNGEWDPKYNHQSDAAAAATVALPMPVVLPPWNVTNSPVTKVPVDRCLLYLEALRFVLWKKAPEKAFSSLIVNASEGANTFDWDPSYVMCLKQNNTVGEVRFHVVIKLKNPVSTPAEEKKAFSVEGVIDFELLLSADYLHYWRLVEVTLKQDLKISKAKGDFLKNDITVKTQSSNNTKFMDVVSVYQYSYACSSTQAVFFASDDPNYAVGIGFINIQMDLGVYRNEEEKAFWFGKDVSDCVGSFSTGSWMGIISSLVMITILMFGYLMLRSVQTVDRFDDPKQKQIVINFKE
ncbi:hypothetical protein AB6A40_008771 [Gnathostoma spinigerum]|uniref:V-type proton ATPase subunit S1/VOA1 transmembrane domain-containing protein n=1 Tax=Gnathostoma spinigerum TaxID=75299 RepID=A0ABD6ESE5_9BILA